MNRVSRPPARRTHIVGTCRACTDCEDDMGRDVDDDEHAYVQCECREFRAVEEQIA